MWGGGLAEAEKCFCRSQEGERAMVQKAKAVGQVASEPKQEIRKKSVHQSATPRTKNSFRYDQGGGSHDHAT